MLLKAGVDYCLIPTTVSEQFSCCLLCWRNFYEKSDIVLFNLENGGPFLFESVISRKAQDLRLWKTKIFNPGHTKKRKMKKVWSVWN